jgi:hypothetical protein
MTNIKKPVKKAPVKSAEKLATKKTTAKVAPAPAPVAQQYSAPAPPTSTAPESIIVQNVLPGPLYISDIGMEFGGHEVKDLTWEDPSIVKRSQDLRRALVNGHLIRISQQEWDNIMLHKAAQARAEAQRISAKRTRKVNADGRILEAEVLNLNKADGGRSAQDQISTAGYASDPMSFATAFQTARAEYEDRGMTLDSFTFTRLAENNPRLVGRLLAGGSVFDDGVTSGVLGRGRATVITPGDGFSTGVAQMDMTNFNRDQRIAGSTAYGAGVYQNQVEIPEPYIPDMIDLDNLNDEDDDEGYGEEIDLAIEDSDSGGIRRL